MNENKPSLSIVTPAYNRGELLKNCYESLQGQSNQDFEWIVVDDGSQDSTKEIMEQILANKDSISVQYIWKENGGKHTALNASHPYIRGKYVLILDSDDTLTPDAVEEVLLGWGLFETDPGVGVIRFARRTKDGRICAYAKEEYIPTDLLREQRVFAASGDSCEVIRTDLFLKYPFPVFEGERFLAETALWYRVGLESECVYINKPIYICEYLQGGLTQSGKKLQITNPNGGMFNAGLRMHRRCLMRERMKAGMLYCCYGFFAGKKPAKMIDQTNQKFLVTVCMLPGSVLHWYWKREYQ